MAGWLSCLQVLTILPTLQEYHTGICTSLCPGTSRPSVSKVCVQSDVHRFQEHGYYGDTDVASGERLCGEGAFLDWPAWLKKSGWTGGK